MAAVALAALLSSGCTGSDGNDSAGRAMSGESDSAGDGAAGGASADEGSGVDLASAKRPDDREVIYTADLEVGADDVEQASADARKVVAAAGGFLFSASEHDLDDEHPSVVLTFKVPPEEFDAVLDDLGDLGEVAERSVNADDVTGQVVDLDARLAAARISADRLSQLLAETGNVGDLLSVERELAQREAQVESLEGQLAALRDQIDLATVTLSIVEPSETTPEVSDDIPGFVEGLKAGAAAFVNLLLVVATAIGFALPFVALAAALGGPLFLILRRRRRNLTEGDS